MLFDLEDVHRSFDARVLERGRFYFLNHRVIDVRAQSQESAAAEVVGAQRLPFAVAVHAAEREGERVVVGKCSCPIGRNCKHAAALALAIVDGASVAPSPEPVEVKDPIPLLRLHGEHPALAELLFVYDDVTVPGGRPRQSVFERTVRERLAVLGLAPIGTAHLGRAEDDRVELHFPYGESDRWIEFLASDAQRLESEGWRIDVDASFPYRIVEAGEEWSADVYDSGTPQWFELELGIEVSGQRVSLLPLLIDALARGGFDMNADPDRVRQRKSLVAKLPSGTYVALPADRVARFLATFAGLFGDVQSRMSRVRLPVLQAGSLTEVDGVHMRWSNAPSVRALFADLATYAQRSITVPDTFAGELRPYQREGVAWLQALRAHDIGGVLADDMGLGKTVQLLAHVAIEAASGRLNKPVLVVAPTSVVPNWCSEIARFLPDARVVSLTGPDRATRFDEIPGATIALTTYALLPRDIAQLAEHEWSILVLDEAQAVKNPIAKAGAASARLRADQRIALTGTPVENHLDELWSIFAFAVPGLLGERTRFTRLFRTPIEKKGDTARRAALAARIRPFLLRRRKENVAQELPAKTEIIQRIELTGAQRDLYEAIRVAMHKRVRDEVARRGLARSRIVVLDALLKLRQACCDPRLVKIPAVAAVHESHKLEALLEMLESLIDDGRRILLFSQFTSMLDLIKPELEQRNMPFVELRGDTRDRATPVARFQAGEVPLFLISLRAGGTGLNLTAADTVIHYDPWWNPAVERQATDRAHRIGQQQHVFVYKLIAQHTVEEGVLELQERKRALADSLFDENQSESLDLSLDDVERLFA